MTWLRERPERWEELDTVDWQGKFITDGPEGEEGEDGGKMKDEGKLFDDEDDEGEEGEEEEEEEEEDVKGKGVAKGTSAATTPVGKVKVEKVKSESRR